MSDSSRLMHNAFFYGSDDDFVATLVPFLREGLSQGDAAVAAVTPTNIGLLRDALGADAAAVSFIDRDEWYRRPPATVAGWQQLLGQATENGHAYLRVIGEVAFGPAERHQTWTRYESMLNQVFADNPVWIACPYDSRALPPSVLEDARRTHPAVLNSGSIDSDLYVAPEELFRMVREPLPPAAGPPAIEMTYGDCVAAVRHAVRVAATAGGWLSTDRLDDLLVALTEIVTNSLLHGAGQRALRVWAPQPALVCEVIDEGPGPADPLVGYRPPGDSPYDSRGLWLAQQLCDSLAIDTTNGTTRVRFAINPALPG